MAPRPALGDRSWFPRLEARAYWNHAALTPTSEPVRDAMLRCLDDFAARGVSGWFEWMEQRNRLRADLGRLVGADPDDLGLVGNTSRGVQAVALGIDWRAGDRIHLLAGEFPTNVTPWQRAADRFGCEVVLGDYSDWMRGDGARGMERLEREAKAGLRLFAVSAVQFQTGFRMPLAEIGALCRRYDVQLFVDGIQAAGIVPLALRELPVDYFAAGSHKWLNGPEGGGFVYIHPDRMPALRPTLASWLSHEDAATFLMDGAGHLRTDRPIRQRADFVEGGVMPTSVFAGLGAAVEGLLELGIEGVYAHVQALHDAVEGPLIDLGLTSVRHPDPARRSGILAMCPPQGASPIADIAAAAERAGVAVATPDGYLRFSPHWPAARPEAELVVEAIAHALHG